MKHAEEDYINWDPFEGDMDVDIRCRKVKLVRVRKQHQCHLSINEKTPPHNIEPGQLARYETAFVDGSHWGSYYCCIHCMDAWFDELNGDLYDDDIEDELAGELEPEPPYRCERTPDMFGGAA